LRLPPIAAGKRFYRNPPLQSVNGRDSVPRGLTRPRFLACLPAYGFSLYRR
jgi:hypothetical protein